MGAYWIHCDERWTKLVGTYTSMSLTCPGEKLVALSGIAKQYAAGYHDTYIAGMWQSALLYQLLWCVSWGVRLPNAGLKPRPSVYRAPSWSWASIDGHICIQDWPTYEEIMYHIKDVYVAHATNDVT